MSLLWTALLASCSSSDKPLALDHLLEGYHLADSLQLSIVTHEPLIKSPIAIDFDLEGQIWILELPGYMANLEGTGENDPVGRIVKLQDKDQDGYYETAIPFLEGLRAARAFRLVYGGLLLAEPPNLWFYEIDGQGAGKRTLVDSAYVQGGNIEHQPNGLEINLDNWIYSAKSAKRYRRQNGEWLIEPTTFRGQWGITHDSKGRLFYNDNSNPLYGDYHLPNQLNLNPYYNNRSGESEVILPSRRVYPLQATSVNRGYIEGVLDEEGKLKSFTSACGPVIYRGSELGTAYAENAFVCGPEVNLVKRILLVEDRSAVRGKNAYEEKEFLIAEDEAFRPVTLANGPDGALYIVDYHKGIIQHKVYMTAYLREEYIKKGLDTIMDYGRILKIQRSVDSAPMEWPASNNYSAWVDLLGHQNGWVRDAAQQFLIRQNAKTMQSALEKLALDQQSLYAPLHALWTLEGLGLFSQEHIREVVEHGTSIAAATAVQLLRQIKPVSPSPEILEAALQRQDPFVDWQVAWVAGQSHGAYFSILQKVLKRHERDTTYREVALSGLAGAEEKFLSFLAANGAVSPSYLTDQLKEIIQKQKLGQSIAKQTNYTDTKTKGLQLFRRHCVSCHGESGQGIKNLAPPLISSEYVSESKERFILLTLHGLQGPIHVNGKRYEFGAVMPGLKDNPSLSDEDIANLLSYVRNAFADDPYGIEAEAVEAGRSKLPTGKMYTEEELKDIQ